MKILRKTLSLSMIILIIFTFKGINTVNISASQILSNSSGKTINVAVLLYSFDDLFMSRLKQSFEDFEKENSDKVKFTFYDGQNNIAVQNQTIDSLLQNDVDLILANLADVNERSVENVISRVKQKNIPIVLLDVAPQVVSKVSKEYNKAAYILANSDDAGKIQGKILVDLWNTNKDALDKNGDDVLQYILLQGEAANPVAIDRSKYAISTINEAGIKTQKLELVNANWLKEFAKSSIQALFLKYGGNIEAIVSNNDAMAIGVIEALQEYGYNTGDNTKKIAVVGIDAIPEAKELVDKGLMTGTVVQEPRVLAEVFYNVGMNLVNNLNPTENTNYKVVNGEIIIPFLYKEYTKENNAP